MRQCCFPVFKKRSYNCTDIARDNVHLGAVIQYNETSQDVVEVHDGRWKAVGIVYDEYPQKMC